MQKWTRYVGLVALMAGAQPAAAITAPAAHDAFVGLSSSANNGAKPVLRIQSGSFGSYVKFDLSTLPPGVTGSDVASARLLLFVTKVAAGGPAAFDVVRVTSSWQESSVSGLAAPSTGAVEASGVAVPTTARGDFLSIDVTSVVQDWLDGVLDNEGLALIASGGSPRIEVDSKESKGTSQGPTLEIALTSGGGGPVTSANIVDGTIVSADLSAGAVANNNLAADAVTSTKIQDASVATADLANAAVDGSKLANSSVTSAHIVDDTIVSADISNGTIDIVDTNFARGIDNTAVGASALGVLTTGSGNTAVGKSALAALATGSNNTAVGESSLLNNTGSFNTALGRGAMLWNSSGAANTAVGYNSLSLNTTASSNTALGYVALANNSTGADNTAVGRGALDSNTTGSSNTAVGKNALAALATGSANTAVGESSLLNNTGSFNTALGRGALLWNSSGAANTAVGHHSLSLNTTASGNTALGYVALANNATGADNTAVGRGALDSNTTGSSNTAVGKDALNSNTGTGNLALGTSAGSSLTTGSNNIAIGNTGVAGESSTIRIGSSGTHTATHIAGIHGATSTSGIAVFVNSAGKLGTTTSSRRFKTDIRPLGDVSRKLLALRPVRFKYKPEIDPDGTPQYGLIAEEVAAVYPDLVVNGDDGKPYTVRYHLLAALLLAELQKQHATIDQVRSENAALRQQVAAIARLQARLDAVEVSLSERGQENPALARAR